MTIDQDMRRGAIRKLICHIASSTTDEVAHIERFEAIDYRDATLAELERDRLFGEVPFIAAHGSEIPEPYDFVSVQMPRNDVVIVRQQDGGVKAFVNACRHRGAQLVTESAGRSRVFSCPYHRWSYGADGTLRAVTLDDTFGDFDRAEFGLVELPVEERHGFIWLIDNAQRTIDVADWLGPRMDETLGSYGIDQLVSVTPQRFERATNWKIMQDGFLDNYHVKYAHPTTAATVLHTNAVALEDFGRHFWFVAARKSLDQFIDVDPGDTPLDKHVIESCFLAPNSMLLVHSTHVELLTFRPCGADPRRSVMEMRIMAPRRETTGLTQEEWDQRWAKNWRIMISIIHDEDFPILEGSQKAMENQDAGTMLLGRNEISSHLFRREIRRLLGDGPAAVHAPHSR